MCENLRNEFKSKKFRDNMIKELGNVCVNCGSEEHIHYHHIVPLIMGGTNRLTNIVPLCEDCHGKIHIGTSYECARIGIKKAREKKGYNEGRPKKFTKEELDNAVKLRKQGYSYSKIVDITGISKSTLIRHFRKISII